MAEGGKAGSSEGGGAAGEQLGQRNEFFLSQAQKKRKMELEAAETLEVSTGTRCLT